MNNFEAKYIKLSAEYLSDKMKTIHVRDKVQRENSSKQSSRLTKLVTKLFQTKET